MVMIERFKAIFTSPSGLFNEIKKETDYKPTLMYYFVFVLGLSIISFIINLIAGNAKMIQTTIVGWVTSIIGVLVFAFFISLVASWFGGARNWVQGLKAVVYPATIFAVFGLILSIIGTVLSSVSLIDLSDPQAILKNLGAFVGVGIVIVLVGLGLLIWTIMLYIKGIKISHDVSGGKAFGTLIIAGIFTAIVSSIINWILTAIGLITPIVPTV